jgi:hypothetical protein
MSATCPCCGETLRPSFRPIDALRHVPLAAAQRRLLDVLISAYPRTVAHGALVEAVWGHRADGGPDGDLFTHLAVLQGRMNRQINQLGWNVGAAHNGVRGSRRLSAIEPVREAEAA